MKDSGSLARAGLTYMARILYLIGLGQKFCLINYNGEFLASLRIIIIVRDLCAFVCVFFLHIGKVINRIKKDQVIFLILSLKSSIFSIFYYTLFQHQTEQLWIMIWTPF